MRENAPGWRSPSLPSPLACAAYKECGCGRPRPALAPRRLVFHPFSRALGKVQRLGSHPSWRVFHGSLTVFSSVLLVFGFGLAGVGCSKGAGFRGGEFEIVAVDGSAKVPKVPVVLWEDWMKKKATAMDYARLKSYLIEETPGVLGKKNYQVQFPQGGGQLDLGDFLNSEKSGLWSLAVDVDHADEKDATLSVYFVSHGKRRKLGGQIFGSGCGRILEVTSYFTKSMKKKGFEVSSSGARDISAIGGIFFFVVRKAEKMWLSRLTITDRYRSKYLCQESSSE